MIVPNLTVQQARQAIIEFVLENFPSTYDSQTLPTEESLVELGVLDSYGVVEIVSFMEDTWSISIPDEDITREKLGSITKMAKLVLDKIGQRMSLESDSRSSGS